MTDNTREGFEYLPGSAWTQNSLDKVTGEAMPSPLSSNVIDPLRLLSARHVKTCDELEELIARTPFECMESQSQAIKLVLQERRRYSDPILEWMEQDRGDLAEDLTALVKANQEAIEQIKTILGDRA